MIYIVCVQYLVVHWRCNHTLHTSSDARSCLDVRDVVEKLKLKAIAKIREFLLEKVNQFKKPMANYQVPQNTMVKFK